MESITKCRHTGVYSLVTDTIFRKNSILHVVPRAFVEGTPSKVTAARARPSPALDKSSVTGPVLPLNTGTEICEAASRIKSCMCNVESATSTADKGKRRHNSSCQDSKPSVDSRSDILDDDDDGSYQYMTQIER